MRLKRRDDSGKSWSPDTAKTLLMFLLMGFAIAVVPLLDWLRRG
jgi:hypothetical protein